MNDRKILIGFVAVVLLALIWALTEWVWLGGLMVSAMFFAWMLVKANDNDDNYDEEGWEHG